MKRTIEPVVSIHRLGEVDEELERMEHWMTRPIAERFAFAEELRRQHYGPNYGTESRLPRTPDAVQIIRR